MIIYKPTESISDIRNSEVKGVYEGIEYLYAGNEVLRSKYFIRRRIQDLKAFIFLILRLIKINFYEKVDSIIVYTTSLFVELIIIMIAKLLNIKILKEESENPEIYFRKVNNKKITLSGKLYINNIYKKFDGIIVMTDAIREYLIAKGISAKRIVKVAQTFSIARINATMYKRKYNFDYIAYIGSLSEEKDGVLSLIHAYYCVHKKYPQIYLLITGFGTLEQVKKIQDLILQYNISEFVILTGRLNMDEIFNIEKHAKILLSCRPKSQQASYGFPTKVIEYLASGKPVVTTAEGELNKYLLNGKNAYVLKAPKIKDVYEKISFVLENYAHAEVVAQRGKKLVQDFFNPSLQTKKILDFII